jgi:hypothetical protein
MGRRKEKWPILLPNMAVEKQLWVTQATCQMLMTNGAVDSTTPYKQPNSIHIKSIALQHIGRHYKGFQRIYTDGRKEPTTGKTGAAIYDPSGPFEEGYGCTDISVYSAEMIAVIAALKHIQNKEYRRTVGFSDSLPALQTLQT